MRDRTYCSLACLLVAAFMSPFLPHIGPVHGQEPYRQPPQVIRDILNAPPTPLVSVSPARDKLLLLEDERYPPVAELAEPMLRLAGLRINPQTFGPARAFHHVGFALVTIEGGKTQKLDVPAGARLGTPQWAPHGREFAFTNTTPAGIELWTGDAATGQLRRVPGVTLNAVYGEGPQWMPDGKTLLCQTVVSDRGHPPAAPKVPLGPMVQESHGRSGPVRTYQDLLQNAHDAALFDYCATSQLVLVDLTEHRMTPLGKPGLVRGSDPSPDGKYFLVVRTHKPFSYLHTASAFPKTVEVWDRSGHVVFTLADLPLEDRVPIEGVPTGPRGAHWHPTAPATLLWVEAQDEGDPKKKVPHRDIVYRLPAPFASKAKAVELARTEHRFAGLTWTEKGTQALLRDYDRDRRRGRTFLIDAEQPGEQKLVWDRSIQDRYRDPGTPFTKQLPGGHRVLWQEGDAIFLSGPGASPAGDRPFLDRFDLKTLKAERLFQSHASGYESVVALVANDGSRYLTRAETPASPPNYYLRTQSSRGGDKLPLTDFKDPAPQLRSIKKELVTYKRNDGVQLSFTLYLPPGYKPGTRLPTVVWAYPREFNDADTAGQVVGSPNHFTTIRGPSHLFFLLQGYAILDGAALPVVGDPETVNNTYLEQIVAGAKAAIDKAVEMGVTDRNRVGVGGHSYGAFMTANLLAHSDLFKAGIARSGAYNRTLTPFGFQSERRTLWEAPETYLKMSPFMVADKIKTPILLIHGEADNNPGTFPVQSERMYQAIRGNGGAVRYVVLPYESHGYAARESVEHTLYEMIAWFDKYVKNAPTKANGE